MSEELAKELREYAEALKKIGELCTTLEDTSEDLRDKINGLNNDIVLLAYKLQMAGGAHCTKCGDPVTGKEDGLCFNCV